MLYDFLTQLFADWRGRMSGSASLLLTVLSIIFAFHQGDAKWLFFLAAALSFVYGAYHVWSVERKELMAERSRNQRPEIKGELLETHFREAMSQGGKHPYYLDYYITLKVHLVNIRQVSTTIKEFVLKVETSSGEYFAHINRWKQGDLAQRKEERRYGFFNLPVSNNETIIVDLPSIESLNASPLNYGEGRTGWLNFIMPKVSPEQIKEVRLLTLVVVDAFGTSHEIIASQPWKGAGEIFNRNEEEDWAKLDAQVKLAEEKERAKEGEGRDS
jgi:hypothetical protein